MVAAGRAGAARSGDAARSDEPAQSTTAPAGNAAPITTSPVVAHATKATVTPRGSGCTNSTGSMFRGRGCCSHAWHRPCCRRSHASHRSSCRYSHAWHRPCCRGSHACHRSSCRCSRAWWGPCSRRPRHSTDSGNSHRLAGDWRDCACAKARRHCRLACARAGPHCSHDYARGSNARCRGGDACPAHTCRRLVVGRGERSHCRTCRSCGRPTSTMA